MAPINVGSKGEAIPMNATQDDKDVAKAKAELANSQLEGDAASPNVKKSSEEEEEQAEVDKKEFDKTKMTKTTKADDVLMSMEKEDLDKDGQINKKKITIKKLVVTNEEHKTYQILSDNFLKRKRSFQISYGVMFSKWSKVDSNLKDDSRTLGLSILQALSPNVELNLGLDFIHAEEDDYVPENIRMFQFHATTSYLYKMIERMKLNLGLGILASDYNIRSLSSVSGNVVSYNQYANGTAFGLSPEVGFRYQFQKKVHVDLMGSYAHYFGTAEKNFGGLGLHAKIIFDF